MNTFIKRTLLSTLLLSLSATYAFAGQPAPKCNPNTFLANTAYDAAPPPPATTGIEFYFLPHELASSFYTYVLDLFSDEHSCR
jgi:hypothetical protein